MAADRKSPRDASWMRKIFKRFTMRNGPEGHGGEPMHVAATSQAEYWPKGRASVLDGAVVYKGYRIHTAPHVPGLWISMIVRLGPPMPVTKDSLTASVTQVPEEYASEPKRCWRPGNTLTTWKAASRREEYNAPAPVSPDRGPGPPPAAKEAHP